MAPRFLIDENLSPLLAYQLRSHGFDAVHVQELGLRGVSDADLLARAVAENRIVMTGNADDFRKLGARTPRHPGLAIILEATGRTQQLTLGTSLAHAIDQADETQGRLFEIDRSGNVRSQELP